MTPLATLLASLLAPSDTPAELSPMQVTAGRHEASVFDASRAVSVVDRGDIEVAAPLIAADLMRGLPGVFVQQTTPGQGIPIVRGLKGSENLHLVDGFRLNNAFFRNAPNQYVALVEPTSLDRIEVVRGPASTLYGSDALGGVIQLITRKPEFDMPQLIEVRAHVATADDSVGVSAAIEQGSEQTAWRVHAATMDVGDRRTGSGTLVPSGYQSHSLNASVRRVMDSGLEGSLNVQISRQPRTPRIDELVPGFGQQTSDSEVFFFEPNQRVFAHGVLEGSDALGADHWQVHLGYQEIRDDRRTRDRGSREERRERNTSDLWGVTAQFDRMLGAASLVYGLEYYHDEVDSARRGRDIDDGSERVLTARFPTGSTQQSMAVYAEAEFQPTAQDTLTLGGRYSRFDIDLAQADRPAGAALSPDELTFSLGWLRALTPGLHLTANVGEGFRAPNIFDLATLGERPGNRFNVGNPNLGPEQLRSIDAGLKWQGRSMRAELFGFFSRFDDKITSVATGEITPSGRTVVRSENVAEVDLYGIEFGAHWEARQDLEAYATINWTRGEESGAGPNEQPADRIPPLNGRLGLVWDAAERWRVESWTDFARRQDRLSSRDEGDPRINPLGTPGWATVNLRVDWQATPHWGVGLSLENLADRSYREHGSGIDGAGFNARLVFSGSW